MFEVRAYVESLSEVHAYMEQLGASKLGEYAFKDSIYHPKTAPYDLNKEFMRVRVYKQTNWDQKDVELTHKRRMTLGNMGLLTMKEQFDHEEETKEFLMDHVLAFTYTRKGTEYKLNHLRVFVEEIEGLPPSVEVLAESENDIDQFFQGLPSAQRLSDSVPKLIERAKSPFLV